MPGVMTDVEETSFDFLNLNGPLTVEAILRALQRRFNKGCCYVSVPAAKTSLMKHINVA